MKEKNFLFVCGCPRSGTTVLTQLLNWHPKISLGIERFGKLLNRDSELFLPRIFNPKRFFKIRKSDCFYDSLEFKAYSEWYCSDFNENKYKNSTYVGDKNPKFYEHLDTINSNFRNNNYKIIFILRDINSVAKSYNVRANNPNDKWKAENDFKQAIVDWNKGISSICHQIDNQENASNLISVNYDDFFSNYELGKSKLSSLFSKLELNLEADVLRGYELLKKQSEKIIAIKENNQELYQTYELDEKYISSNALLDKYYLIKDKCI
jgi:hypothetical protein